MAPLRFGLIGFGHFGKQYVRLLQTMPGASLEAIASHSAGAFEKNQDMLPVSARVYTHASDVLQNSRIDCVIIATPPSTHHELIQAALRAGKHVLVEKPMVQTQKEAEEVRQLAEGGSCIFMVAFQYVYNDYINYLRDQLNVHALGKILYVLSENLYLGPMRSDASCFLDAGSHELSLLEYLFAPGDVSDARGTHLSFSSAPSDFTAATIHFDSGLAAHLLTCWFAPEKKHTFTVVGDHGMAVYNDRATSEKLQFFDRVYPSEKSRGLFSTFFTQQTPPWSPSINAREPLQNELEHFIACVRTGSRPRTDVEFGYRIMETYEAINTYIQRM
ncbi:MAG: Gfo/Idh/MocA family oxidoreductase [Patescibacteria group bacterium]